MTKHNPHTRTDCTPHDLILVDEGVQCGQCLTLVTDKRIDRSSILQQARELFEFRNHLEAAGFKEDLIAEVIRRYGTHIPVFGSQLEGVYIRSDTGQRGPHTAIPGWYSILNVEGNRIWIKKHYIETADVFECGTFWLPAVVGANMEMIDKGHPSPDDKFQPEGQVWMGEVHHGQS